MGYILKLSGVRGKGLSVVWPFMKCVVSDGPFAGKPAPTGISSVTAIYATPHNSVGAGLPAKTSLQALKNSTLLKHLHRPLPYLLLRQIFLARGEKPQVPKRVLQCPAAITVELILDLGHRRRPGIQCSLK